MFLEPAWRIKGSAWGYVQIVSFDKGKGAAMPRSLGNTLLASMVDLPLSAASWGPRRGFLTSVCSWCRWSERRWRQTWGSRCTDPRPGSLTLASGSPPLLRRLALTDLQACAEVPKPDWLTGSSPPSPPGSPCQLCHSSWWRARSPV